MNACPSPEFVARYRAGTLDSLQEARDFDAHLQTCVDCRQTLRDQTRYAAPSFARHITPSPDEPLHLSDTQMLDFIHHRLETADLEVVTSHLDLCSRCRAEVEDLRAFHEQMQQYDFQKLYEQAGRPDLRERIGHAWHQFTHAFGLGALHGLYTWWSARSLNWRLVFGVIAGALTGLLLRGQTAYLDNVSTIFLRMLQALATPFIFIAIVHTLMDAEVTGRTARRLAYLALSNTLVAIAFGLFVGNIAQPGKGASLHFPQASPLRPLQNLPAKVPQTLLQPLLDNNILFVVLLAVAFGISLRMVRREQIKAKQRDYEIVESLLTTAYRCLTLLLNWIIAMVPIAVFAVVARLVSDLNWHHFRALLGFSAAVIFALILQIAFYLLRLWFRASMRPRDFLHGARDAVLAAFSTASSAATLPITYTSMRDRVGVRERSAGLGVLVGMHFNRDGTALYEAITPIFIAQALGQPLDAAHQLTVAVMAVIASIAAPGVPAAGLVTMALVFQSVGLPREAILLLLAVDWLLDRCRTTVNVLGGMTVTCLLDRRTVSHGEDLDAEVVAPEIVT